MGDHDFKKVGAGLAIAGAGAVAAYVWGVRPWHLWRVVFEPAHFIMERKMLLGIKERAEKLARERALEKLRTVPDYSGW